LNGISEKVALMQGREESGHANMEHRESAEEIRSAPSGDVPKPKSKPGAAQMFTNLLKSVFHNIGVVIVGLGIASLGTVMDSFLGIAGFASPLVRLAALLLLALGFLLRAWATVHFYARKMRVISLEPQKTLITAGPYRFSRNPLYLGGNVFIFFGAALLLGSPTALFATAIHIPFMNLFIRREERQLERDFGEEWQRYAKRVRRWL
jgi:protein-S-isoprenylcysteine O-methyltransferase Ste14